MANPENLIGKGFDANPQNINTSGRPKKGISLVNTKLKEMGYEPASKQDIQDIYLYLIQLPKEELEKLSLDDNQPILVTTIVKSLISGSWGMNVIERILDRGIGKPTQETKTDHTTAGMPMNVIVKLPE